MLPEVEGRLPLHTRRISFEGHRLSDGLFQVDCELRDTRNYDSTLNEKGHMPAGSAIHRMAVRITVTHRFEVVGVDVAMGSFPYLICSSAGDAARKLVGASIGKGWRAEVERAMGGIRGCTHVRELLITAATAVIQTITGYLEEERLLAGQQREAGITPHFIGKCKSWDESGVLVQQYEPTYFKPLT
jgi:hypothetical protein